MIKNGLLKFSCLCLLALWGLVLPRQVIYAQTETNPAAVEDKIEILLAAAAKAMNEGDFRQAVQLYTKILSDSDHKYRQTAQENLGLAQEKAGKPAHARAEYQEYLRLYPTGEGAVRVAKRLAALEKASDGQKQPSQTRVYGSFSELYFYNDRQISKYDTFESFSDLTSYLDFTLRRRSPTDELRFKLDGSYNQNLTDSNANDSRLSYFYLDYTAQKQFSTRVGRQRSERSGVLGRFDGALLGWRFHEALKFNLVTGQPVETTKLIERKTHKFFYGVNCDLGTFARHWDFNVFLLNQDVDGLTDRRAVGGEGRYLDEHSLLASYIDYDYYFNELNYFLLSGNYTLPTNTTFNAAYDYRQSPPLTISNAIIGQDVNSPAELLDDYELKQINELARERTALNKTFLFGVTQQFTPQWQINGDVTVTDLLGTEKSGGVEEIPATGNEYYYNLQLTGSGLLAENDLASLGWRSAETRNAHTSTYIINTRYPLTTTLRVYPKYRVDFRTRKDRTEDRIKNRGTLGMDYRWWQRFWLEAEASVESDINLSEKDDVINSNFLTMGCRIDF